MTIVDTGAGVTRPLCGRRIGRVMDGTPTMPADRGAERRVRLADLLTQARDGHRDALDHIVSELTPVLWHTVRAQGLGYQAAQDAVQLTWLALVRHLHTIRTPAALLEWLVTTARREAWHLRTAAREAELMGDTVLDDIPDPADPPDHRLLQDERARLLWSAVARLPAHCRDLLRIVAFVHRPDYDAVSAALGMPRGSIGPTRGRCLAKLRTLLAEDPGWSPS
ncbi:sigma-70 family RNA polymerase sigma factor [Sphaerisporangium sp. B11E5]|uniref:RNA polymerase sigma factor n=1 Tax=Sphaerisporangium sp. B11E5 TaxID=3153563 RepID=UPI00325E5D0C